MAQDDVHRSVPRLCKPFRNPYSALRGSLLILNVLLYTFFPVAAVAAPQDHRHGSTFDNAEPTRRLKWHNAIVANLSQGSWGSTFGSGSGSASWATVTAYVHRGYTNATGFRTLSNATHGLSTVANSRNISTYLNVTASPNMNASIPSINGAHNFNQTTLSPSTSGNSTLANAVVTTRHASNLSASFMYTPTGNVSVLSVNSSALSVDFSLKIPALTSSVSNSSTLLSANISTAKTAESSPAFPSKTPFTSPTRNSSTHGQSNSSSVTSTLGPSSSFSITPTPLITGFPSSSINDTGLSLPPDAKLTTRGNHTIVLIPIEARKVYQSSPSSANGSSSTASIAGAAPPPNDEAAILDKQIWSHSPGAKAGLIILGVGLLGTPIWIGLPAAWIRRQAKQQENDEKKLASKDFEEDARKAFMKCKENGMDWKTKKYLSSLLDEMRKEKGSLTGPDAAEIRALLGPQLLTKDMGPSPFDQDPAPCDYSAPQRSEGCSRPPPEWNVASETSPDSRPRHTHSESFELAEGLPPVEIIQGEIDGMPAELYQVPAAYAELTLDGKIAYCQHHGLKVFQTSLRFPDGRSAAVGPGNSPLAGELAEKFKVRKNGKVSCWDPALWPKLFQIEGEVSNVNDQELRFRMQNFPKEPFKGVGEDHHIPFEDFNFAEQAAVSMQMEADIEAWRLSYVDYEHWWMDTFPDDDGRFDIGKAQRAYWADHHTGPLEMSGGLGDGGGAGEGAGGEEGSEYGEPRSWPPITRIRTV